MTISKTPRARHIRFLSHGFFPPEMPACFYSSKLADKRQPLLVQLNKIPPRRGAPHYYSFKSQRAIFSFPRFSRDDRRHSYINPIAYFYLSKHLAEHYVGIRKINRRSKMSVAQTIFDWGGERALIRPAFEARDTQRAALNASHEFLAEFDISAFYHSIYTHAIPWAIHGKPVAKARKQDMTLYGNVLDLLVRNAQDGQTIGLPVGPDTSRLLAEIIGTAIDHAIQTALRGKRTWNRKLRSSMRFVDDFAFGCASLHEAEAIVAVARRCVNDFELELNSSKTRIAPTGPFFPGAWKEHIRSLIPPKGSGKAALLQYFYGIEQVVRAHPEANVEKFALMNSRQSFLENDEWPLIADYLLSCYRRNPSVVSVVAEIILLRHLHRRDVDVARITAFIAAHISTLARLQKRGEIAWLLFVAINLDLRLRPGAVEGLFGMEDAALAVLVSDAKRQGIITGSIDQSLWDQSLTADGLRGSMWLYAYESALKGLNAAQVVQHATTDPYFGPLFQLGVEFYRSGDDHIRKNTLLAKLRFARLRHYAQEVAVTNDLAEDYDDFDEQEVEDEDFY